MSKTLSHPKYRPDIDGLRAIAVMSVIIFHAFPSLMGGGFMGVDIFFVISGFLISTIIFENLDRGTFSFSNFYARRIKRIFPALLLVLTASLVFGWFFLLADEYKQLNKHVAGASVFVSNFILWDEVDYFDNDAETKPLLHLWSLSIEEQFYIIWPLLLWCAWRYRLKVAALLVVLIGLSFIFNVGTLLRDSTAAFYFPHTRFWELLSGSFLAWIILYKKDTLDRFSSIMHEWLVRIFFRKKIYEGTNIFLNVLSWGGILLLASGFWFINRDFIFPGAWTLFPVLGTFLIIMAGSHSWINRTFLSHKVIVWFGLISYPLYLWHWPILSFARITSSELLKAPTTIILIAVSIVLAWLTYRYIENPIRHGGGSKKKVIMLVSLSVTVLIFSIVTYTTGWIIPRAMYNNGDSNPSLVQFDQKLFENPDLTKDLWTDKVSLRILDSCFVGGRVILPEHKEMCDRHLIISPERVNVMILGDSHADDFHIALKETHEDMNVFFAGGSGCKPTPSSNTKAKTSACVEMINRGLDFASENNFDYVVFANRWQDDFELLSLEIARIKHDVQHIVLIGPAAEFHKDVPRFIARRRPHESLSKLSMTHFNFDKLVLNEKMKAFAKEQDILFIERISYFCTTEGDCELIDDEGNIYIYDYGHLTRTGARFWGNQLLEEGYFKNTEIK